EDDKGGGGGGDTSATLSTTSINPSSGPAGSTVRVRFEKEGEGVSLDDLEVVLGDEVITPAGVDEDELTFVIPTGLAADQTLFLRAGSVESNRLRFTISDSVSIVAPDEDELLDDEGDSKVAANLRSEERRVGKAGGSVWEA